MQLIRRSLKTILVTCVCISMLASLVFITPSTFAYALSLSDDFTVTFVNEKGVPDKTDTISDFDLRENSSVATEEGIAADDPLPGTTAGSDTYNDENAPAYPNHTFMRAFIGDPTDAKKQLEIVAAKREDNKVVVVPRTVLEGDAQTKLYYPLSDSNKIYLQYFANASYAEITYNDQTGGQVTVSGEDRVGLTNGSGTTVFTVSTSRDNNLQVAPSTGSPSITEQKDYSTKDRTVIQYKATLTQNSTFNISTTSKTNSQHTISFDTSKKSDWAHDSVSASIPQGKWNGHKFAHFNDIYKVNGTNYAVNTGKQTTTVVDKSTLEFYVYHDRDHYSTEAINTQLAAVYVGGMAFPAPQPLSRYGASMYESHRSWIDAPKYNNINSKTEQAHNYAFVNAVPSNIKWLVPVFAKAQGYNAWWKWKTSEGEFQKWYTNSVLKRVIGAKTRREVKVGSLAGSVITIEVVDAKPLMYKNELGSNPQDTDWSHFADYDRNKMAAYGNTLRLMYKVTVENVRSNLDIDTEWSRSDSVKIGMYLNRGVEDVQVWASQTQYTANTSAQKRWVSTGSSGAWFDIRTMEGSTSNKQWNPNWIPVLNPDPKFKFQATLKNGYTDPRYRDGTWSYGHWGEYLTSASASYTHYNGQFYDPQLPVQTSGNMVVGEFPLFAATNIEIFNNGWNQGAVVFIGGMNIVGVTSTPAKVTGYFDLNGGTLANSSTGSDTSSSSVSKLFPDEAAAKTSSSHVYDVESNTVIRIPIQRPQKNGLPLVSWELHRVSPATSSASRSAASGTSTSAASTGSSRSTRTARSLADASGETSAETTTLANGATDTVVANYLPGEQLSLLNETQMGSRITSTTGDVLVDKFYFKAIYEDKAGFESHSHTINLTANDMVLRSTAFSAIEGATATIDESAAPEFLTSGEKLYVRKIQKRDLASHLTALVTEEDATFTFDYEEAQDIIPIPEGSPVTPQPNGYCTVSFVAGEGGTLQGTASYFVRKDANKQLKDLQKPTPTPNDGYAFSAWDQPDETPLNVDLTVTASFVFSKTIIPKGEDNIVTPPAGYVTVTFEVDPNKGAFGVSDKTVYFVKRDAGVKVSDLTKPTVTAKTGYKWEDSWSVEDEHVITGNLTITAQLTALPHIDTAAHPNYVKITFNAGAHGAFDTGVTTVFYVNPEAGVTFTHLSNRTPTPRPHLGYAFDTWTSDDIEVTNETPLNKDMTITATYTTHPDIVEATDPSGSDKPSGYVTVEFNEGEHGTFEAGAVTKYYVKPQAGVLFENLLEKEPKVTPKTGYSFTHWASTVISTPTDEEESETDNTSKTSLIGLGGNEVINKDMVVTAQYESIANIIPVPEGSEIPKPEGYVTVEFKEGDHGKIAEGVTTKYYVNPNAGILFENINEPDVLPNAGYIFTHWTTNLLGGAGLGGNEVINKDMVVTAQYEHIPNLIQVNSDDVEKPEGYVTVTFVSDENGHLEGPQKYYVNPSAGITYGALVLPEPFANDGYEFSHWETDGEVPSDGLVISKDMVVTARFKAVEPEPEPEPDPESAPVPTPEEPATQKPKKKKKTQKQTEVPRTADTLFIASTAGSLSFLTLGSAMLGAGLRIRSKLRSQRKQD